VEAAEECTHSNTQISLDPNSTKTEIEMHAVDEDAPVVEGLDSQRDEAEAFGRCRGKADVEAAASQGV